MDNYLTLQKWYFDTYQKQILWLANTHVGRDYLGIPHDDPIIFKFLPWSYHKSYDDVAQVTAFSSNIFNKKLIHGLLKLDAFNSLGYIKDFSSSLEVFLDELGLRKSKEKYPHIFLSTTGDVNSNANGDGNIYNDSAASWTLARNATTGTVNVTTDPNNVYADGTGSDYYCSRLFTPFINPSIPVGQPIISADFKFTVQTAGARTMHVVRSTQASATSKATTDFDNLTDLPTTTLTSCGSISGGSTGAKTIALNATGLSHITPASDIKFCIINDSDQVGTDPNRALVVVSIYTSDNATDGNRIKLNVTYGISGGGSFFLNFI